MVGALAGGAGLLGLAVGSFLNVVAHRVPEGRSVIHPGSACPECGHPIRPGDNVPLLSWALLRGRCRDCGAPISARYPAIEASTALLFAGTALVIGARWVLPAYLAFAGATLVLAIIDLEHHRLPNRILYPATLLSVGLLLPGALLDGSWGSFLRAPLGGIAYFALLLVVALAARGGFGFGDVKLAFLLGVFLAYRSWGSLVVGIFVAVGLGGLAAVALLMAGRRGRKDAIPYGPALVAGAWLAVAYGDPLLGWYLG